MKGAASQAFKKRLIEFIDRGGITKMELAKRIGVSRQMLDRYLNLNGPVPGLDVVESVAKALDISIPTLLMEPTGYPQEDLFAPTLIRDEGSKELWAVKECKEKVPLETGAHQKVFQILLGKGRSFQAGEYLLVDSSVKPRAKSYVVILKEKNPYLALYSSEQKVWGVVVFSLRKCL